MRTAKRPENDIYSRAKGRDVRYYMQNVISSGDAIARPYPRRGCRPREEKTACQIFVDWLLDEADCRSILAESKKYIPYDHTRSGVFYFEKMPMAAGRRYTANGQFRYRAK